MNQTLDLFNQFKRETGDTSSAAMLTLAHAMLSNQPEQPESLTVKQSAERLNVSDDSIYDLVRSGKLRAQRIGRTIRVRPKDLDAFQGETMRRQ